MFREFSDAELVILYHRMNMSIASFLGGYSSKVDEQRFRGLECKYKHTLWEKINEECIARGINTRDLTVVPVVTAKDIV